MYVHIYTQTQAESNVQGIFVSDPKDGVPSFGLVGEGREQAKEVRSTASGHNLREKTTTRQYPVTIVILTNSQLL